MKRALIHIIAASLFWGTGFYLLYHVENRIDYGNWNDRPELFAGRDVRHYERIQLSSCYLQTQAEVRALLYRFLWLHWTEKTPALAEITYCGIDAGATYYYFVEKDSWGEWSISIVSQGYHVPSTEDFPLVNRGTAYFVERFGESQDGEVAGPIDPNAKINNRDFILMFFDRHYELLSFSN